MRRLDYGRTPLGWGIDIAAAMFCHTRGLPVVVDTGVHVAHPRSTAYDSGAALRQMLDFLRELTLGETLHRLLLKRPVRHNAALRRLIFWATRPARYRRMIAAGGRSGAGAWAPVRGVQADPLASTPRPAAIP
jgi:hypothetical protein